MDPLHGVPVAGAIVASAFACAALMWPVRWLGPWPRAVLIGAVGIVPFVLPAFLHTDWPILRGLITLETPLFSIKLLCLGTDAVWWRGQRLRDWIAYLLNPIRLVPRLNQRAPVWPRRDALRMLARGLIEITLGGLLVAWAFASPWPASLRIVEHLVKLTAGYLAVFDGGFVTLTGLCALLEGRALLQSNHPVLAVTPADFWRRYNMEAGRYFRECVFRPVGGLRRPVVGVLATFAVNGAFHEYLASMLVGEVRGYQLAFFAIQGTAVAVTLRWRPRGRAAVLSWVFTLLLMASSSVLFCLSLRGFIDVYP